VVPIVGLDSGPVSIGRRDAREQLLGLLTGHVGIKRDPQLDLVEVLDLELRMVWRYN
jgi:hypothetical protein